jgi:parallel beta-helix repeat protein
VDGSISPSGYPIMRDGNLYTLTADVYGSLSVERGNIVIDGAGHAIRAEENRWSPWGVTIYDRNNVTLTNIKISGFGNGVSMHSSIDNSLGCTNCVISNNEITQVVFSSGYGLWVDGTNNVISGNRITSESGPAVILGTGSGNVLSNNTISDSALGISFMFSSAILRDNRLNNNGDAFDFLYYTNPVEDIDASNMVDGMPVCYWVNQRSKTVPSYSGYVLLVNCTDITVQGLSITTNPEGAKYNSNGIKLINTLDSVVAGNLLTVGSGIKVLSSRGYSKNITITRNILSTGIMVLGNNISVVGNSLETKGIYLGSNSLIAWNNLTSCDRGINLQGVNNKILQNNIADCDTAIWIFEGSNNIIYHNNFINNKQQVYEQHYDATQWPPNVYRYSMNNIWDDGYPTGGNYWSNYTGRDDNGDGIGDTPHMVYENYTDQYPLMAPVSVYQKNLIDANAPSITIQSPENRTYNTTSLDLNFAVNKPTIWMGYSLDGDENVTVIGNTTLAGLSAGLHNVTVYAKDEFGNIGASETVVFTVAEEPFPVAPVAAASVATIAVVGAGLVVYFKKRRH